MTSSGQPRTQRRRAAAAAVFLACAPLLTVVACSGSDKPDAAPSSPKTTATTTARNLDAAAKAAKELVDQYTPAGYPTSAVVSGYDWANQHNQEISESLPGKHLFQIACTGPGTVSVKLSGASQGQKVICGSKSVGVPFTGKLDAVVDGSASNSGTYAWRILRQQ